MQCARCHAEKAPFEFYAKDRTCKVCRCALVRANRAANVEHYREHDRRRSSLPHRRELNRTITAAWREQHPQRRAAQVAVGNAIRDGKLQRWPCEVCGAKAHAHHVNYDAPLLVTWLCPPHHKAAHLLIEGTSE